MYKTRTWAAVKPQLFRVGRRRRNGIWLGKKPAAVYAAVPRVYHERHTVVGCGRRSTRNKNCRSYPDRERRHKHQRKHGAAAAEFHNLKHCVTSDII